MKDTYPQSPQITTRAPLTRLPKRVAFSSVIDEVVLESTEAGYSGQQPMMWSSYLPSSYLVARPPLTRATSLPTHRSKSAVRPILRRSPSLHDRANPIMDSKSSSYGSTEMSNFAPEATAEATYCRTSERFLGAFLFIDQYPCCQILLSDLSPSLKTSRPIVHHLLHRVYLLTASIDIATSAPRLVPYIRACVKSRPTGSAIGPMINTLSMEYV